MAWLLLPCPFQPHSLYQRRRFCLPAWRVVCFAVSFCSQYSTIDLGATRGYLDVCFAWTGNSKTEKVWLVSPGGGYRIGSKGGP